MAAASAQAADTTSFPNYPLLTGGDSIPPNIMLILDDSGSMGYLRMPNDSSSNLNDSVSDRSYINNTLYYNPDRNYYAWRTASTSLDDRLAAANFKAVSTSGTAISGSRDLRDSTESFFYIPKTGVANPGTSSGNYDKYRIASSTSSESHDGGVVQRQASDSSQILSDRISSIAGSGRSACFAVPVSGWEAVAFRISGSQNARLYVYSSSNCSGQIDSSTGNGDPKNLAVDVTSLSVVYFQVQNGSRNSSISNINYTATVSRNWVDATPLRTSKDKDGNVQGPRAQADELQNFANWYQYHRTRNKMAKAGASEAFGRLGKNFRVGFDTIWNRGGNLGNVLGSAPAYPIPYQSNDGLFEAGNRQDFYSRLQGASASGNTPLHGALQRSGRYFSTDDPWKDSTGNMLACRQNYALLTTDGYWNQADSNGGYNPKVGNADKGSTYGDNYEDTLADVAYHYWKTDLKPGLANDDTLKTWQNMVTFGISIGLQGTLDPTKPPPSTWPDPIRNSGGQRIDDLWHASLNGQGSFVVATDTDRFANALDEALKNIASRSASGSNIASSSTKTESTTLTFVAGFTSNSWIGDMIASPFNAALTGVSNTPLWALSKTFAAGGANANFAQRTVLTSFGGTAQVFNNGLSSASVFARSATGTAAAVSAADNIDYLRGVQSKEEGQKDGVLRKRAYPLGDIVDSSPAFVEDSGTVFVGANDGMLHAISVKDGKILFSYVPKGLDFAEMAKLSSPDYEHHYFVDGQMDVISRANQGNGKNILVAALGRGGRGVFALDVTNPTSMGTSNVLWDQTFQTPATGADPDGDMGYVFGPVRIRNGNADKTYALVPNGIDSPNGSATLYAYELSSTGSVVKTHKLVAGGGPGNGLMSTGMADLNGDGKIDVVYGGDLKGNVWRWNFEGTNPGAAVKLFQAVDSKGAPQAITGGLGVGRDTSGKVFVGFGTGRFISNSDVPGDGITSQVQSIYGIIDTNSTIAGRTALEARTIPFSGKTKDGQDARGFEAYSVLGGSKQGWYIDLPVPERVTTGPTIYGSAMYLTSVIPATGVDCSGASGTGFVNAINLFTGTSPKSGGYFTDGTGLTDKDGNSGVIGSVGVKGGMPTEVNVTDTLVTVGTGTGPTDLSSGTDSEGINTPTGGKPSRISWREILPE
ncbi:PilC/PilY family type IV pilus protein [Stenotrophomonas sp. Iso1]|uniref:pilus assembly protein n=1 Tax=Stenotrophomonas sp. Iso1 TaxID=2977283 RepID=UPI0022B7D520|nr:PilC/PilY family type IV pilus protein [Stenotrophomonas sp. Iso1]